MSSPTAVSVGLNTAQQGRVATITIDRLTQHPALAPELLTELEARINQVADTPAQVLLLRTLGDNAFSGGADIAAAPQPPAVDIWREWIPIGQRVFDQLARLSQHTVAVVDGLAIGGGAELALACDFRVATDRARIGPSGVGLGTIPGWGGTQRLTQLIGAARAHRITRSRPQLEASTAVTWGLLTSIAPAEELQQHVAQLIGNILHSAPIAQQINKQHIDTATGNSQAIIPEPLAGCFTSYADDFRTGVPALQHKSTPNFLGQ